MQQYWGVEIFETRQQRFGRGRSKFEVLTQSRRERCLILDDDIVFLGKVIDRLECFDDDFIVACHGGPPDQFNKHYFDLERLKQFDPDFHYAGGAFNSCQVVATTGIFHPRELDTFLTESQPREIRRPDVFRLGDQGLMNYLFLKRLQQGKISLRHEEFMWWSEWLEAGRVRPDLLERDASVPIVLHWAGPKPSTINAMRHAEILRHFQALYFSRLPVGEPNGTKRVAPQSETSRRMTLRRDAVLRMLQKRSVYRE